MATTEFPSGESVPTQRRRQTLSALLHRLVLMLTLTAGGAALVYNAVSIVSGERGLVGLYGAGETGDAPIWRG
jgi:hypothetical protein